MVYSERLIPAQHVAVLYVHSTAGYFEERNEGIKFQQWNIPFTHVFVPLPSSPLSNIFISSSIFSMRVPYQSVIVMTMPYIHGAFFSNGGVLGSMLAMRVGLLLGEVVL